MEVNFCRKLEKIDKKCNGKMLNILSVESVLLKQKD